MSGVEMAQLRHRHTEFDRVLVQIYLSGKVAGKMVLKSFWVLRPLLRSEGHYG